MIRIIITLALAILLATTISVWAIQAPEAPTTINQAETVNPAPKAQKAVKQAQKPSKKKLDPVLDNPNGCDLHTQYVWNDFSCHDKPVEPVAAVARSATTQQAAPVVTGNKQTWLAASGIPESVWPLVDYIVTRESGWNPNAVNPSSGACGLGQQLPCGKWPGAWNDPVAALVAMNDYVNGRYGGWSQAHAFWSANHWY